MKDAIPIQAPAPAHVQGDGQAEPIYVVRLGWSRFVIYNAEAIGNPPDHQPGLWYFRPYPLPLGEEAGRGFASAEEAEKAARDWDIRFRDVPVAH